MPAPSLARVALLLSFSGACALVYQVVWFRELRLIFGASTASSAAVLAVFMAGLGAGGMVLGKRADRTTNPLAFYAQLEAGVAVTAAISPGLVLVAQFIYLRLGGAASLGTAGATIVRLLLAVVALGPSAFLMGGTLPAAARAVAQSGDAGRQRLAVLYGVNTLGAVLGTFAANFLLVEVFGGRLTLWITCLVNVLVAMAARVYARGTRTETETSTEEPSTVTDGSTVAPVLRWFPAFAAGVAGLAFLLMELVWYRMLAPLLGGSSYTFGLILALALAGIGLGGLLYSRTKRPATIGLFALTCALEAFALALPYALGDRVAMFALLLRPLARASFSTAVLAWALVASIVVLPAAIVSGYQFPVIFGLYGRGSRDVAKHVGHAYLANTIGSIAGSVGGGFGLLPLLSAPRCWQLVTTLLLGVAALAAVLDVRALRRLSVGAVASFAVGIPAALLLMATGPTAGWRHSGIGAGRADTGDVSRQALEQFVAAKRAAVLWEADGLESSVAVGGGDAGYSFIVNGKSDGSILGDAATQVMGGVLGALVHGNAKAALVVGLGTGSTAGWLGVLPGIERVDAVELEPSILRVARDCALANNAVLDNPKVKVTLGDAREVLRTTRQRYDIVFSEPSNPYRAGISSLYTEEFYRAVAERLNDDGLFVQWIQTYEVDTLVVTTAAVTVHQVFPHVSIWQSQHGDLLLIASRAPRPIDVDHMRTLLKTEQYSAATRAGWLTDSAEGVLARFVSGPRFVDLLAEQNLGILNTDDRNFLEFAFARSVGNHQRNVGDELRTLTRRLDLHRPETRGSYDAELLAEEEILMHVRNRSEMRLDRQAPPARVAFARAIAQLTGENEGSAGWAAWAALKRAPRTYHESKLVALAAATEGDERARTFAPSDAEPAERALLHGIWLAAKSERAQAIDALERGFLAARREVWVHRPTARRALIAAQHLGTKDPPAARRLAIALSQPFAVAAANDTRLRSLIGLAREAGDPPLCVTALENYRVLPLDRFLEEVRVDCYRKGNDPRLPAAEAELAKVIGWTLPFGAHLPSAPGSESAAPIPSEAPPTDTGSMSSGGVPDRDAGAGEVPNVPALVETRDAGSDAQSGPR